MLCSRCNETVDPVVVFDIDGTLGDYHRHFRNFCTDYFGRPMQSGYPGGMEFHEWLGLELKDYRAAKLAYRQGGQKRSMDTYLYATQAVQNAHAAGCEVWIATTRPFQRLDNIDPDTVEWCKRNGIAFDGLLYGDDKYEQLFNHVDPERVIRVYDDLPEQVMIARKTIGDRAVIMMRQHNELWRSTCWPDIPTTDLDEVAEFIGDYAQAWRHSHG